MKHPRSDFILSTPKNNIRMFKFNHITKTFQACVSISSNGVQSLCDNAAQAPLDVSVNLSDCCGLDEQTLTHATTLITTRGTQEVVLSETKNLSREIYENFVKNEVENKKSLQKTWKQCVQARFLKSKINIHKFASF